MGSPVDQRGKRGSRRALRKAQPSNGFSFHACYVPNTRDGRGAALGKPFSVVRARTRGLSKGVDSHGNVVVDRETAVSILHGQIPAADGTMCGRSELHRDRAADSIGSASPWTSNDMWCEGYSPKPIGTRLLTPPNSCRRTRALWEQHYVGQPAPAMRSAVVVDGYGQRHRHRKFSSSFGNNAYYTAKTPRRTGALLWRSAMKVRMAEDEVSLAVDATAM